MPPSFIWNFNDFLRQSKDLNLLSNILVLVFGWPFQALKPNYPANWKSEHISPSNSPKKKHLSTVLELAISPLVLHLKWKLLHYQSHQYRKDSQTIQWSGCRWTDMPDGPILQKVSRGMHHPTGVLRIQKRCYNPSIQNSTAFPRSRKYPPKLRNEPEQANDDEARFEHNDEGRWLPGPPPLR